jgi:hypothetical protein
MHSVNEYLSQGEGHFGETACSRKHIPHIRIGVYAAAGELGNKRAVTSEIAATYNF